MSLVWPILAHLSAEPLVGLKRTLDGVGDRIRVLSAEPLVGLKRRKRPSCQARQYLSAEPLVGLKLPDFGDLSESEQTFSRTPRGFEASWIV